MILKITKWLRNKCRRRYLIRVYLPEVYSVTERFWTYKVAMSRYEEFSDISELYVWAGFGWFKIREMTSHRGRI